MMWIDVNVKQASALVMRAWDMLVSFLQDEPKDVIPVMTYASAIEYFVTDKPPDPRVKKGVMLLRPRFRGYTFLQTFLDENNEPVLRTDGNMYGRQLIVKELDSELSDLFNDKDYIIVE